MAIEDLEESGHAPHLLLKMFLEVLLLRDLPENAGGHFSGEVRALR